MKYTTILKLLVIASFGLLSCQKELSDMQPLSDPDLSAATEIIKGQTAWITFPGLDSGAVVNWEVSPATSVEIYGNGPTLTVYFADTGRYEIKGIASGITYNESIQVVPADISSADTVQGDSSEIPPPVFPTQELLTGDQLVIEPAIIDSSGITSLFLSFSTRNSYNCLNSSLIYSKNASLGNYSFEFYYVEIPTSDFCEQGDAPAKVHLLLSPVTEGEHAFSVKLNGIEYAGSFIKQNNKYSFNWNYSEGVIIAPQELE